MNSSWLSEPDDDSVVKELSSGSFQETIGWKRVIPSSNVPWGSSFTTGWSLGDQRDTSSQHSRGSIWADDQSRSSHASFSLRGVIHEDDYAVGDFAHALQNLTLTGDMSSLQQQQQPHHFYTDAFNNVVPSSNSQESQVSVPNFQQQYYYGSSSSSIATSADSTSIPSLVRAQSSGSTTAASTNTHHGTWANHTTSAVPPPGFVENGFATGGLSPVRNVPRPRNSHKTRGNNMNPLKEINSVGKEKHKHSSVTENTTAPATSQAIQQLLTPKDYETSTGDATSASRTSEQPILPSHHPTTDDFSLQSEEPEDDTDSAKGNKKKDEWLWRMNRKLEETPTGEVDPSVIPVSAVMNAWAKTKSSQGAGMVEMWLERSQLEYESGNTRVVPNTKMFTMAVDAWARSGEGAPAAHRAEALLQRMNQMFQTGEYRDLRPTVSVFAPVWLWNVCFSVD